MIQIISYTGKKESVVENTDKYEISRSSLNNPQSLDSFGVNVVDLNYELIWRNKANDYSSVNCIKDLFHLGEMIKNSEKTKTIIVLPQNITMKFYYGFRTLGSKARDYSASIELKNMLDALKGILSSVVSFGWIKLMFESTVTTIEGCIYDAAFYFQRDSDILIRSDKSDKPVAMEVAENVIVTTLNLKDVDGLMIFLNHLGLINKKEDIPEWMEDITILDDKKNKMLIGQALEKIESLEQEIESVKAKLEINQKYKSILYENGTNLLKVIFEMLEEMLECNLSQFVDENREDFLIELDEISFIGEVKGVTSNVRSEHISQLDNHYHTYMDKLYDEGHSEEVKAILIINYERKKKLTDRNPVHEEQIGLAQRNKSLIIDTFSFLRLFESYKLEKINKNEVIELLMQKEGLLNIEEIC